MIPRRIPYFAPKTIWELVGFKKTQNSNEVEKLEKGLNKYLQLPNPVVVGQGRIGLTLILKSLAIAPGSEIIMPGYTFGTLTEVIKKAGFTPRPVDIDHLSFQMSPVAAQKSINNRTGAILATHLFGEPCDIKSFQKLAKKHNLFLIEDCAQSLGATLNGKLTGTFGDAAFSSFDIAKPLQGIRGGVVFSANKKLMDKIRQTRDKNGPENISPIAEITKTLFGYYLIQTPIWPLLMFVFSYKTMQKRFVRYYRRGVNKKLPYTLPSMYAYITRQNLLSLKDRLKKRRAIRKTYYDLLNDKVEFQQTESQSLGSVYMLLAHVNTDIFKLRRYLSYRGIDIALADEIADNCLKKANSQVGSIFKYAISLPVYEELTEKNIIRISNYINQFLVNSVR